MNFGSGWHLASVRQSCTRMLKHDDLYYSVHMIGKKRSLMKKN